MITYAHLTEPQRELLRTAENVAKQLTKIAAAATPGRVNRPLIAALAEHGLLDRMFTKDGVSAMELCLLREGLARYCTEAETALALQGLGSAAIVRFGQPNVVAQWIPKVAAGTAVAAFAMTEPDAGSDVAAMTLAAERDGDDYRLTGDKIYISNAPDADIYTVFAKTGPRAITAFAVPGNTPGLTGESLTLLAPHPIGRLRFDDVRVPANQVLGEPDRGMSVAMRTLDLFRPSVGAFAVGMGQAALDLAVAHAVRREAFGRPLRQFQGVSHQLAEVAMRLQAARLLVHSAATAYDQGAGPTTQAAAMAKLFGTETAQFAVDVAIQVHGAAALVDDHPLAHLYREVRAPRIYEGASEIQREIIARELFRAADARS